MTRTAWPPASICSYPSCLQQEQIPEHCLQQFCHDKATDGTACMAALAGHLLTAQARAQIALFDGDLVKAYLLAEVHGRHPIAQARHAQESASYAFSNIHSLAEATGFPRETVRRKILQLIDAGWVTRLKNGGLLLNPARQAEYHGMLLEQARLVARTAGKLRVLQAATRDGHPLPR